MLLFVEPDVFCTGLRDTSRFFVDTPENATLWWESKYYSAAASRAIREIDAALSAIVRLGFKEEAEISMTDGDGVGGAVMLVLSCALGAFGASSPFVGFSIFGIFGAFGAFGGLGFFFLLVSTPG